MKKILLLPAIAISYSLTLFSPPPITGDKYEFEATPSWVDEFSYDGKPDSLKWSYDTGGHGWGNRELQYYTNKQANAFVTGGKLHIVAQKDTIGGMAYSSARLVTKNKADFLYGRFEISARLPPGRGSWPAIWMMPTKSVYGGWPRSGEIDIMEHVGYDPGMVHFSTHTEANNFQINTQITAKKLVASAMEKFHTYRVDWTPESIKGYIDGEFYFENHNAGKGAATWPFDQTFHLLLNVAVGGNWGGQKGIDSTIFPATMLVDYVRMFKMIKK